MADSRDARIRELKKENERLRAAISWLRQPFVNDETPEHELRQRVKFMLHDVDRAAAIRARGEEKREI